MKTKKVTKTIDAERLTTKDLEDSFMTFGSKLLQIKQVLADNTLNHDQKLLLVALVSRALCDGWIPKVYVFEAIHELGWDETSQKIKAELIDLNKRGYFTPTTNVDEESGKEFIDGAQLYEVERA